MSTEVLMDPPHDRTLIMGVVNVTPDSFYPLGRHPNPQAALVHAKRLVSEGSDILDIGGESSRPGAEPVSPDEEWARIAPILELTAQFGAALSVDTYHAPTARRALEAGAGMINDITALRGDPDMAGVVSAAGCAVVLMHMRGTPQTMQDAPLYDDVIVDICAFFEERMQFALQAGIREEAIWLDPGFGFGKEPRHNLEILRRLGEFQRFGRPLLIGTSNKSTIGKVLGSSVDERTEGTAATVAVSIAHGADAVRVHDVKTMARVARMTDAIMGKGGFDDE